MEKTEKSTKKVKNCYRGKENAEFAMNVNVFRGCGAAY
jgi:hypothetical protein